ncbi:DinB family protein [Paraliobacillus sp. JSM ZJ581]|uniref:DinB family protein n=1 Tax=Paraliobacillus sp. JSM ZJ581 TaxID=3342118 RepID=UPI0035A9A28C
MKKHFQKLYIQREEMNKEIMKFRDKEWNRPYKDKWSWGETYYHLYLMMKWFRRLSMIYIPLSKPIASLRKNKPYNVHSYDIYEQFNDKYQRGMKAPFILVPPKGIESGVNFEWLLEEIDKETNYLEQIVSNITDDVAGHIRFPDPVANNPNLIQCIDLLGIHEKHHFLLCQKYYFGKL